MTRDVAAANSFPCTTVLADPGRETIGRIMKSTLEVDEGFPLRLSAAMRNPKLNAQNSKRKGEDNKRGSPAHV